MEKCFSWPRPNLEKMQEMIRSLRPEPVSGPRQLSLSVSYKCERCERDGKINIAYWQPNIGHPEGTCSLFLDFRYDTAPAP